MAGDELEFVDWLRKRQRKHHATVVGIGDDMAIVDAGYAPNSGRLLLGSDMLLDGVHFDTAAHPLPQIGRKAVACCLSDCAAMAVCPLAATVSVALPRERTWLDARQLFEGMFAIAAEYEVALVGGDTTRWGYPLAIDVTMTATPYDGIEPVLRSGAKPGDRFYVTGHLGGSLLGRHLTFAPRVHEARTLAASLGERLHAMIDISDGLALDLWRICEASGVGATVDEGKLEMVVSDDARKAAAADEGGTRQPLDRALGDGEDFELLLAVSGDVSNLPLELYPAGEVSPGGLFIRRLDGRLDPLQPKGYVH